MSESDASREQERRTRWSFAYHSDNTWYWQAKTPAGGLARSEVRLETLADAMTDAMGHGYIAWTRAAERRRDSSSDVVDE
jgi:hypothetical protein